MTESCMDVYGTSQIGKKRRENQDWLLTRVWNQNRADLVIADGMGGEAAGGMAARTALNFFERHVSGFTFKPEDLGRLLIEAGDRIRRIVDRDEALEGMGTTMTALQVLDHRASWAHAGDSRLYHLKGKEVVQITRDHRFVQELIDYGDLTPEEASSHPLRGQLDQCLGTPELKPDFGSFNLTNGDLVMLTTDGLHDHVTPMMMKSVLNSSMSLPEMTEVLFKSALDGGSTDDIGIILGRIKKPEHT